MPRFLPSPPPTIRALQTRCWRTAPRQSSWSRCCTATSLGRYPTALAVDEYRHILEVILAAHEQGRQVGVILVSPRPRRFSGNAKAVLEPAGAYDGNGLCSAAPAVHRVVVVVL